MTVTTWGKMPDKMPKGFFKAVRFPVLAKVDEQTSDHRLLDSTGGATRPLPLSIRYQPAASPEHEGAMPSGTLFEVTLDPENKTLSGRGFLLDDPTGRLHARMIHTQAQDRNSIDLADVKARFEEDLDSGDYRVRFTNWNLAATTGVGKPAFAEAHAQVDPLSDEELMAALGDPMEELVADCPFEINLIGAPSGEEITASAIMAPFDAFFQPEADRPQKITVTANRWVSGHLALWETCHDGIDAQCVVVPRPSDGYASFNKPGPLTERGQVQTGPIFAYGGHRSSKSAPTIEDAYGGIENAWCDVRVTEGRFGPWVSGYVRPHIEEETVYSTRASRISGHWVGGRLKAIVSVNAEGFDVPGEADLDLVAGFAFSLNDDGVSELVASFPTCLDGQMNLDDALRRLREDSETLRDQIAALTATLAGTVETPADHGDPTLAALLLEEPDL
jgi:hypothetical protein